MSKVALERAAAAAGFPIARVAIARMEEGTRSYVSVDEAYTLASVFNVSVDSMTSADYTPRMIVAGGNHLDGNSSSASGGWRVTFDGIVREADDIDSLERLLSGLLHTNPVPTEVTITRLPAPGRPSGGEMSTPRGNGHG